MYSRKEFQPSLTLYLAQIEDLEPSHKMDFKTSEEWEENQQAFNDYLNAKITSGLNHIDLKE